MFDNVLVGVDGRPGGADAVVLARQLAAPGGRLTLVNIYGEADWPPVAPGIFLPEQRVGSEAFLDGERDRWRGVKTIRWCAPTVGRGLHEMAARCMADLLVVGSPHHGALGRVLMGDDTRAAFNGAPCAIAIAPQGYATADTPLARIGVGFDGTPESHRALAAARRIAESSGARITLMWVIGPEDVRNRAPIPADWRSATAALIDQAQLSLDAIDGIEGIAVCGGPREELTRFADGVDVLIVGSRGYGPLGCVLHGSVSSYLERHVASGLLVVPRDPAQIPAVDAPADPQPAEAAMPVGQ